MWPRIVELMVGLWMLLSPFIFSHAKDAGGLWATDLAGAALVMLLAGISFAPRAKRAHLLLLPLAVGLGAHGYLAGGHPAAQPGYTNQIGVALVLLLVAIIPTGVTRPPGSWREFYEHKARTKGGRHAT